MTKSEDNPAQNIAMVGARGTEIEAIPIVIDGQSAGLCYRGYQPRAADCGSRFRTPSEKVRFRREIDENYRSFQASKAYRDSFVNKKINGTALPMLSIEVKDENGAIAKIAGLLSMHNSGIRNIEVINNRENLYGALRIAFPVGRKEKKLAVFGGSTIIMFHG